MDHLTQQCLRRELQADGSLRLRGYGWGHNVGFVPGHGPLPLAGGHRRADPGGGLSFVALSHDSGGSTLLRCSDGTLYCGIALDVAARLK
ncbi:MAG: hypothetical protein IPP58_07445 [Holophagaceae bacterium]|uniref:Uncharacterized protein n=1 Tax=Candidatus Geothrix skivensis TaxID=2954439 RepID=A0A9D7SHJ9_9BACT|nr:hypothetical protein [Candidatus Geothrix skivensis]